MKSSHPEKFRRIPRKSDFHVFQGDGCRVTPRDKIVYENLESQETTWVKFLGYNFNLNRDGINGFEPKSDPNEGGHMARCGLHIQLKFKLGQKGMRAKKEPIP